MVYGRQDNVISGSRELLWLAMVLMWSQVTEVTASPQPVNSATFEMLPVSDVKFTQDVLWEKPAWSEVDCGGMCVGEAWCSTFTFTPSTYGPGGSCRIHGKRQTPQGEQESAPGALSYINRDWIEKACITSSGCPDPMAACYSGQCLCDGGFFFDYSQNACVSNCTKSLGDTYLQYKGMIFAQHNEYSNKANGNLTTCLSTCTADPKCTGFNRHSLDDECFYKYVTAQSFPEDWKTQKDAIYCQKTCK